MRNTTSVREEGAILGASEAIKTIRKLNAQNLRDLHEQLRELDVREIAERALHDDLHER